MGRSNLALGTHGTIRFQQRGATWRAICRYRDFDGVIRQVEAASRSKAGASQALQLALKERTTAARGDLLSPQTRLAVVAEKWYLELEGLSPSTMQAYRDRLDKQVLPALGQVKLRELTVGLVDRHLQSVKRNYTPAVAKGTKTVLSSICGLAARHDALRANPVRDTARISVQPKKRPEALTVEQVRTFRTWLETDPKAIARDLPDLVALLAGTGMRIGEACALTWADVDFTEGTVSIRGTVLRIRGEGLVLTKPKSRAGERTIELPSWCLEVLRRRRGLPSAPVFPAPLSGRWRDPSNTAHWLKEAFQAVGLDVTSHVFRKTVASILSDNQVSPRLMADQLGHSRPSISLDVYLGRNRRVKGTAPVLEQLALFNTDPAV